MSADYYILKLYLSTTLCSYPGAMVVAMASTRGERLRAARKKRFKSARAAALAMGIAISTYGAHERAQLRGGREYGPDEAKRYARRFGVTPEWLLTGLRQAQFPAYFDTPFPPEQFEEPRTPTIPLMGYVAAGSEANYYQYSQGYLDEIEWPKLLPNAFPIVEIREYALGGFFERWRAYFDEMRSPVTPDLLGYVCVVGTEDKQILLRLLQPGRTQGRYDLISEFGTTFRDVCVDWAAKLTIMLRP